MNPKLSVVIPCYNHGKFLPEALKSLDDSGFRDRVEVIVVDDGSNHPETVNVIDALDRETHVVIRQPNQGLAKSRNNGIEKAQGEYVLMLDADNSIRPKFLSDFFSFIEAGRTFDALYGNAQCFGGSNELRKQGPIDLIRMASSNHVDACAIFNKKTLTQLGLYDADMPCMGYEDWDLWIRLALNNADLIYNDKVYFNYRVSEDSMIHSHGLEFLTQTREYLSKKHGLSSGLVTKLIETYLNKYIDFSTVVNLLLKKLRLTRNKHLTFNHPNRNER